MIETERLRLRAWRERDRAPYHAIKSNPRVMATLGPPQTRAESDATLDRWIARAGEWGHSFWAMERRADGVLLGYCGLVYPPAGTPVSGEREIGWGLGAAHWGQSYAREAAAATLAWGWAETDSARIVAITTPGNSRSWGLMERLGMTRLADGDFDHPALAKGNPLRPHLSYAIGRPQVPGSRAESDAMPAASRSASAAARVRSASSAG